MRAFGDDPSRSVFFFTMVERTGRLAHMERSGKLVLLVIWMMVEPARLPAASIEARTDKAKNR